MKIAFLLGVLLWGALSLCAAEAKQPLAQRVKDFAAKYDTEAKITQRLQEWNKEEPNSPEPYILAANAYLKISDQIEISTKKDPQGFTLFDPKTNKAVGSINRGPTAQAKELALATASEKFPQRLDIFVGRMVIGQMADDVAAVLAAGKDLIKSVQSQGEKLRWIDDAPLPEPPKEKAFHELQGRIDWLYQKQKDDSDEAGRVLAEEALKIVPDNPELLNDAAIYYCYRDRWAEAKPFLERAEKADPKDVVVKLNLGMMYSKLGEKKLARAKYQEVIKLDPGSADAKKAQKAIDELGAKKKTQPSART